MMAELVDNIVLVQFISPLPSLYGIFFFSPSCVLYFQLSNDLAVFAFWSSGIQEKIMHGSMPIYQT
jgi:hypothetical protein